MTKEQAIRLFGDTRAYGTLKLAEAMGVQRHAIYQWPDELEQRQADQVLGAAIRLGRDLTLLERPIEWANRVA